jgi:hypothetical protein
MVTEDSDDSVLLCFLPAEPAGGCDVQNVHPEWVT